MKLLPLLALSTGLALVAHAAVTETMHQTYSLSADGAISLENVNGSVEIVAWDRPEVALEAEKKGKHDDDLKRIHVDIDASASRLAIKTRLDKKWSFFSFGPDASVSYRLRVPATVRLERIDVVNASVTVRGVRGDVRLESVNGSIDATGLAGAGQFGTVNGGITVHYDRLPASGRVALETVNGSCRIQVPRDAGFELDASSVIGHISCDLPIMLAKSSSHHLRGKVGTGGPQLTLESINGGLHVDAR